MNAFTRAPLEGIRVLDLTSMVAGPYCTRMLADCGAEVIKIEPVSGDHMRTTPPLRNGASAYFGHLNVGKKSVALDVASAEGKAAFCTLVTKSDVVVENFRPGVMHRLGLDYAGLAAVRPDIIYCAISGFGQRGPRAFQPAYAPIVHAASGYEMAQLGYQSGIERPLNSGIFFADVMAAIHAFGAVQTALLGRERNGGGQFIDVALMDTMINLLVYDVQEAQFPQSIQRIVYQPIRAQDGYVVVAPVSRRNFEQLVAAIERNDWLADPRFATNDARRVHWDELMREIERWTIERPARVCEDVLMRAGVPCSRYATLSEALADEQLVARKLMTTVHDEGGAFRVPQQPFLFNAAPIRAGTRVPGLGEHTRETLMELAALSAQEMDALCAHGKAFAADALRAARQGEG